MTDREQALARRRLRRSDDQAPTDSAAVDKPEDNKSEDIWVANFVSRLTGTLRNIGTSRGKPK